MGASPQLTPLTIPEITDQKSFLLDYILYTAAFDSLAAIFTLAPDDIHPWPSPRIVRMKKPFPKGAIVGTAAGAVVMLAVVAFLVYRMQRRRHPKSSGERPEIDPFQNQVITPSIVTFVVSCTVVQPFELLSYTPTPTISFYQPSHTDVGASSVGGYVYAAASSVAVTSSLTSHPPASSTTPTALPPHSQH